MPTSARVARSASLPQRIVGNDAALHAACSRTAVSDPSDAVTAPEGYAGSSHLVMAAAVLVFCLLLLTQALLARRSHRRFNPGLALASVLMAVLAVWLSVAGLVSAHATSSARAKAVSRSTRR